ncbi:MAG: hypothetical protein AAF292_10460 [Pseudomonadota bacterium]
MTLKIELAALGMTLAGAAGFFAVEQPLAAPAPLERSQAFAAADYDAFDRDFRHGREVCAVGIEKDRLCFQYSPLEGQLLEGQALAAHIPLLPAEFPILVATPAKSNDQQLVRFGRSLALIDPETRIVEDIIRLEQPSFADAVAPRATSQDVALANRPDRGA